MQDAPTASTEYVEPFSMILTHAKRAPFWMIFALYNHYCPHILLDIAQTLAINASQTVAS